MVVKVLSRLNLKVQAGAYGKTLVVHVDRVKHINLHDEGLIFDAHRNTLSLDTPNSVPPVFRGTSVIQRLTFVFLSILIYRTMFPFAIIVLMRPLVPILNRTLRGKLRSQRRKQEIKRVMHLCLLLR